jgi:hypothetical protein
LLAADEIRNPNPEKERKILKTKLSPHTTSYRQPYSAAKRRTQTRYRNTQKQQSIDGSISSKSQTRKHGVFVISFLPSCVCTRVCARKMGCPGWNKKTYGLRGSMYCTPYIDSLNYIHTYRIAYYTYENTKIWPLSVISFVPSLCFARGVCASTKSCPGNFLKHTVYVYYVLWSVHILVLTTCVLSRILYIYAKSESMTSLSSAFLPCLLSSCVV